MRSDFFSNNKLCRGSFPTINAYYSILYLTVNRVRSENGLNFKIGFNSLIALGVIDR